MERKLVTVAVDGSAEFTTLTAAAAAQNPAQPLHFVLGAGTYYERPFLELADYIITGAGMGQTVISAGAAGRDPWPGEERTGTFRSQTLFLGGGSARLEHLTVENTAGDGADRGQALAVYADASRVCMVDGFLARQPGYALHRSPAAGRAAEKRLPRSAGEHAPAGHQTILP